MSASLRPEAPPLPGPAVEGSPGELAPHHGETSPAPGPAVVRSHQGERLGSTFIAALGEDQ